MIFDIENDIRNETQFFFLDFFPDYTGSYHC